MLFLGNRIGDACADDTDGDGVKDNVDHCPKDPSITDTSLNGYAVNK